LAYGTYTFSADYEGAGANFEGQSIDLTNDNTQVVAMVSEQGIVVETQEILSIGNPQSIEVATYPNPVSDELVVAVQGNTGPVEWQLISLDGYVVVQRIMRDAGSIEIREDVHQLPQGTYISRVVMDGEVYTRTIVVSR
jgi:CMP-2-keto-3-deoxyoctulosonic acid synthetase